MGSVDKYSGFKIGFFGNDLVVTSAEPFCKLSSVWQDILPDVMDSLSEEGLISLRTVRFEGKGC